MNLKIKTKAAAFCTFAAITITVVGQTLAASSNFTDLANIKQATKINTLKDGGYIKGTGDSQFMPGKTVTAAEGIQFIVNALKLNLDFVKFVKEPKATDYFKKADNNAWYSNTLIIASVNSLDLSADLDPKGEWTREEFTYQLITAMEKHENLPMIKLNPVEISDASAITPEYQGALQRSLIYGITNLDQAKNFSPKAKITRAEAAEEIYNALEYLKAHQNKSLESNKE